MHVNQLLQSFLANQLQGNQLPRSLIANHLHDNQLLRSLIANHLHGDKLPRSLIVNHLHDNKLPHSLIANHLHGNQLPKSLIVNHLHGDKLRMRLILWSMEKEEYRQVTYSNQLHTEKTRGKFFTLNGKGDCRRVAKDLPCARFHPRTMQISFHKIKTKNLGVLAQQVIRLQPKGTQCAGG